MEAYILRLAASGRLPLEDFTNFETDQFRRTFQLLADREAALSTTNSALEGRLVELEAAHRVLQRRTNALVSIQDIGQALISGEDVYDLARRVCRRTCELCGADRAILYYRQTEALAEVLASVGWDPALVRPQLAAAGVFSSELFSGPVPFSGLPPGVAPRRPEPEPVRAGLYMPLVAQEKQVGLMIVQSTQKARFEPGEMALLRTFAQQAALALQRAGLVEQLRAKIDQLEAAQVELARRERLAREMELARQVQQSVLPTEFPAISGYRFAALNEPASRVGGDFYDLFALDQRRLGLAIADVSDKGIPAALYMALTRSLLRAEARREPSPAAVVANVNRLLIELGEAKNFVTLFYAVVDLKTRRLTYTRAGHDRPVLLRNGMALELGGAGAALGLLDEKEFTLTEEEIMLQSGDRLVLYTDGLCDILNGQADPFGRDGFKALLVALAGQTATGLCDAVFDHLRDFRGEAEQYDDMTLLVVEVQ
jgi:sigma-B regulation protein RsbU (phosphoserine phosphatase)